MISRFYLFYRNKSLSAAGSSLPRVLDQLIYKVVKETFWENITRTSGVVNNKISNIKFQLHISEEVTLQIIIFIVRKFNCF